MTKVRESLLAVARAVEARFPGEPGTLTQSQIEAAIAAHARAKIFTADEEAQLIQLRSQLFKSPRKKLSMGGDPNPGRSGSPPPGRIL